MPLAIHDKACIASPLSHLGACASQRAAAGDNATQVRQSVFGALWVLTSAVPLGDVAEGIGAALRGTKALLEGPQAAEEATVDAGSALERVGNFRSNQAAFQHYAKHVLGVDLGPLGSARAVVPDLPEFSNFAEYQSAARAFMGGGADDGALEGIRPGGDLVRLDPKSGYFGVRDPAGVIRTFFRPAGGPQQWLDYFYGQFTP